MKNLLISLGILALAAFTGLRAEVAVTENAQPDTMYVAIQTNVGTNLSWTFTNSATADNPYAKPYAVTASGLKVSPISAPWKMKTIAYRLPAADITTSFKVWVTHYVDTPLYASPSVATNFGIIETNNWNSKTGTVTVASSNLLYSSTTTNVQDFAIQAGSDFADHFYISGRDKIDFQWSDSGCTNFVLRIFGTR